MYLTFKQKVSRFLWGHPHTYQIVQKLRSRGDVFDTNYDILFDGFPRSGNTFGAFMLAVSQQNRLKVNTHRHTPPPFIRALEVGKPTCLTLRAPLDALTSWIIYSNRPISTVIQYYIDFYEVLLPHRSKVQILPFKIITEDFPFVIQLINTRFGLNLESQLDFDACKQEVFERIDASWKRKGGVIDESRVARPYPARNDRKPTVRQALLQPCYSNLLSRCNELHQVFENEFLASLNQYPELLSKGERNTSSTENEQDNPSERYYDVDGHAHDGTIRFENQNLKVILP